MKFRRQRKFQKLKKGIYIREIHEVGIQATIDDINALYDRERARFAKYPELSSSQQLTYQSIKEAWDALTARPIIPMFSSKYSPTADFLSFFELPQDLAPEKGPWLESLT